MPLTPPNLLTSGNVYPCRAIKISGANTIAQAGANELPIGVSQEGTNYPPINDPAITVPGYAAASGKPIQIYGPGSVCLVEAGGAFSAGGRVKADANGKAVAIATTGTTIQNILGFALQAATAEGEKILVLVHPHTERPALT